MDNNAALPYCKIKEIQNPVTMRNELCYDAPFQNLYETLHATANRFPDKIAAVDDAGSITWRQLCDRVDQLSAVLYHTYGVRSGERIGLLMMNSIDFCIIFYAIVKLGAIVVVMNTKNAPAQLQWMLNNTCAKLLFSDIDWTEKVFPMVDETCVNTVVFTKSGAAADIHAAITDLPALLQAEGVQPAPIHTNVFAPAIIMFTSGTTGTPKGALISHFNVLQNVLSYADILKMDETECTVIGVPMFHITGLSCLMALFVYTGGKMVLMPKFNAARANQLMREHNATHFHAVPSIYTMLYDAQAESEPIYSLRSAVCGGGAIAPETIHRYCEKNPNVSFHCAYGMTETAGAGVLYPDHYFKVNKIGSAGLVAPNTEIHILDDDGNELPTGTIGEICFGGSVVIDHYWGLSPDVGFQHGWLRSGDLGKLDEDGFIYVMDRKKDMINRSGEKIFSILVEKEIYNLDSVDMCAVFPVYDSVHGEVPAAVVTLHPGETTTPEDIRSYLLTRLSKYEVPKYIEIVDHIPLNPNNKISKYQLRDAMEKKLQLKQA